MAPRKKKTDAATTTAGPAKAAAKTRGRAAKKGKAVSAEAAKEEGAVTPLERLEGEPSTDIKGDLQRLLDETCKHKTAKGLETDERVAQGLRKILISWRDVQPENKLQKFVYLLETAHDHKKLSLAALDKDDAKKVALLDVHARKYGFQIGLGEVVFYEEGYGLRMCGSRGRSSGRIGRGYGDHHGLSFFLDPYYSAYGGYHPLVDSSDSEDGRAKGRASDSSSESADSESESEEESEEESGEEWEDPYLHAGANGVEMEEVHETKLTLENIVGLDGAALTDTIEFAAGAEAIPGDLQRKLKTRGHTKQMYSANKCSTLERWYRGRVLLIWPTRHRFDVLHGPEARDLVETILSRADVSQSWDVAYSVCRAAVRWGDSDLWLRAVRASDADRELSQLRPPNVFAAISAFGLDVIKECVERAVEQESNLSFTFRFLQALGAKAAEDKNSAAFAFAAKWVPEWRLKIVGAIKNPRVHEAGHIVTAGLKAGGAKVLEKTIIPPLKTTAEPAFLLALSENVHAAVDITPGVKKRIVKDVLLCALSKAKIYHTMDDAATLKFAEAAIKACLQTGNKASAADLAKRLVDFSGLDEAAVKQRSLDVLLPLAGAVSKLVGDCTSVKALAAVKMICDTATTQFWKELSAPKTEVDAEDIKAFLDAACTSSVSVSEEFHQRVQSEALGLDGVDDALPALVKKFSQGADVLGSYLHFEFGKQPPVVQAFALCIRAGAPEAGATIIERVLARDPRKRWLADASTAVFSICSRLPGWLAEYGRAPTDPAYSALFRSMYTFWVDTLMGPLRETPGLDAAVAALETSIGEWEEECACKHCGSIRGFLQGWQAACEFHGFSTKVRSHMKRRMVHYFGKQISAENYAYKNGFKVKKDAKLRTASQWRTWKEDANICLRALTETTSEEDVKIVFGADYARIMQTLRGTAAPANALERPAESARVVSGSDSAAPPAAKRRKV